MFVNSKKKVIGYTAFGLCFFFVVVVFSSPEPKAHWRAYRTGRPPSSVVCLSSVCRPHFLNIFSSETTGPMKVKFHMELF